MVKNLLVMEFKEEGRKDRQAWATLMIYSGDVLK